MSVRTFLFHAISKVLCNPETHVWIPKGTRKCPYPAADPRMNCQQQIYVCANCNEVDNGEVGGHSWESCNNCDMKPKE